jgi:hypothetical protein
LASSELAGVAQHDVERRGSAPLLTATLMVPRSAV